MTIAATSPLGYTPAMRVSVNIVLDESVPDGSMWGHDAAGDIIVALQYAPIFRRLAGTEEDEDFVRTWHVSQGYVRRLAAIHSWAACGWGVAGTA